MYVCCECFMLSGRGLCDELITRPEDSYLLWCVVECVLETSSMRSWHTLSRSAKGGQNNSSKLGIYNFVPLSLALRRVDVDLILPHMRAACARNLILVFPLRFESISADFHLVLCYQLHHIPTPYSSLSASSLASHLNRLQYLPLKLPHIPKVVISHQYFSIRRHFRRTGKTFKGD